MRVVEHEICPECKGKGRLPFAEAESGIWKMMRDAFGDDVPSDVPCETCKTLGCLHVIKEGPDDTT